MKRSGRTGLIAVLPLLLVLTSCTEPVVNVQEPEEVDSCEWLVPVGIELVNDYVYTLEEVDLEVEQALEVPGTHLDHARHAVLTAETMHAETALRRGLVHELAEDLDAAADAWLTGVLAGAPEAQAAIKELVQRVHGHPVSDGLIRETALLIAELRARPEGREGLNAFFEKRPPSWAPAEE